MKKIVIIGASSGLGRRLALDFAAGGDRVGVAARREDKLREIKDLYPSNVEYAAIDVTSDDAVERFYQLIEMIDGMDTLLYAAGVGWGNPQLQLERDVHTDMVNVLGFTRIVDAAFSYFERTANLRRGQIAAITSIAGTKGLGVAASYSASKRYQSTYLQAIDQLAHIRHVNVCVTDVRPGFIRTDLLDPDRSYPMLMSVDYAAPRIKRAIERRRRVAVIDSRWNLVVGLWRLIPASLWRHLGVQL